MTNWVADLSADYWGGGGVLRLAKVGDGVISEVVSMTRQDRQEGVISEGNPALSGPGAVAFAQAVMDAAWRFGLRPSAAQDEKHIQNHLSDMREIARHLLKMDRKEGGK